MKRIRAGFSIRDITPEKPVSGRLGLNHLIYPHHPITAKAAAIENAKGKYLMIVCEVVGLTKSVNKSIRDKIVQKTGIPFENIIITATHTHASPWIWDLQHEQARNYGLEVLDRNWMDKFIENTALAGIDALLNIGFYTVRYGSAKTEGIVSNRVYPVTRWSICADEKIRSAHEGTVDKNVRTISFHDETGSPVFVFSNLACHPSAYGGGRTKKVSPDFPYFAEMFIKEKFGDKTITAYWQGCAGNINSGKYVSSGSEEEVLAIGERLGKSIEAAIENSEIIEGDDFLFKYEKFSLQVGDFVLSPEENTMRFKNISEEIIRNGTYTDEEVFQWRAVLKQLDVSLLSDGREMEIEFQLIRFGSTDILFVPGEWYVEMYFNLSLINPERNLLVTTLNNFDLLYIPDEDSMPNKDWYGVRTGMRSLGNESAIKLYKKAAELLY